MKVIWKAVAVSTVVAMLTFGGAAGAGAGPGQRVNINSASLEELTELPGIGPTKAAAIVEQREREPFRSIADLTSVSGIGERTLEQLRDRISVGDAGTESGPALK